MNRYDRKEMAAEIEERLDNDLDFDLSYSIEDYHSDGVSIIEIDIDIDDDYDYDENFSEQIEDIVSYIISEWDDEGWYSWEGWTLCISIPD